MECPICYETDGCVWDAMVNHYDDGCEHWFCCVCLDVLATLMEDDFYPCPICRCDISTLLT